MSAYSPPTKNFKALNIDSQSDFEGGKNYMRSMNCVNRSKLTEGKLIHIVNHEGEKIMDFPLTLFNAASTKKELVVDDKVMVTSDLDTEQAARLFGLLLQVPKAGAVRDFPSINDTRADLHFHSVAEALGLGSFTQSIFDKYFKLVNTRLASNEQIEAIGKVRTVPGDKIYKQMAWNLAVHYYENNMTHRARFEEYLSINERLRAAVEETVTRKTIAAARLIQHETNHAAFLERQRYREEKAREEAERDKAWQAALRAQQAAEKAKYQERKEKEKAVRQSMLEKKRAGQKLNAEEARAHEKLFGKAVAQ